MSKNQRIRIDARLRLRPSATALPSVEDLRAGFRALMATMIVPDGIRTSPSPYGLLVEPAVPRHDGTILYFHGGGFVTGSPSTALSLTGNLVARTGLRAISVDHRLAPAYTGGMYLGGQDPDQPLLSPAVRADLTGFPPMLLQVGTNEMLLDDSTRLAARARDAGVDVILDITAGVPHVFQAYAGVLDEADEALDRAALFINQRFAHASTAG
jgi:monoterpene epsilon-lactone hydrolase